MLQRNEITDALVNLLNGIPAVNAVWEGGAVGWKRADEWSDIDLVADVEDGREKEVMQQVTEFLKERFGIDLLFEVTQSPWPHITQTFFRLKNTGPFLLIDFCIFKHSATDKFMERQIHGEPQVHFDKKGVVKPVDVDAHELNKKLAPRVALLVNRFTIFQALVQKELNRKNYLEAFGFYWGFTLQPLVEMLRLVHAPYHSSFGLRYIHYDLPPQVVQQLAPLYFIPAATGLPEKVQEAQQLFYRAAEQAANHFKTTTHV